MLAAFDALQYFERAVGAEIDLVCALKLLADAEAFSDDLEGDAGAARGRFPSAEEQQFFLVEAGDGGDGVGQNSGRGVGVGESADGAVNRNEFEGDLLRNGHHDLL